MSSIVQNGKDLVDEIKAECFRVDEGQQLVECVQNKWRSCYHIPYLPAFHSPGWMLRYILGPYDEEWVELLMGDFGAGVTVAATALPQALSYAKLANLPPINGLYTLVLPSAFYAFFGSSMILAVGPVAIVGLLMGQLVTEYGIEPQSKEAVEFAGEVSIAVGTIMLILSVVNFGNVIRFVSFQVMSAFTTAAAWTIGMSQVGNAFNLKAAPKLGQTNYHYNYEVMNWYPSNFYSRDKEGHELNNSNAYNITFAVYFPLIFITLLRYYIPLTKAQKNTWWFKLFNFLGALSPLIAVIIAANVTWRIKTSENMNFNESSLSIVGPVPPGVDFIKAPVYNYDFGKVIQDVLAMTLIAFMESYSVARRLAIERNEVSILNASQEMWANSIANFMSGISSGFVISGSYSRSALNAISGAKTPISKVVTMMIILLSINFFTETFYYIPNAALSAIIWVALFGIVKFSDYWYAWKHSKKDFFTMIVTSIFVFVFNTEVGLGMGLACSIFVFIVDTVFRSENEPSVNPTQINDKQSEDVLKEALKDLRIKYIRLNQDLNFLTVDRLEDAVIKLTETGFASKHKDVNNWRRKVFDNVTSFLDAALLTQRPKIVDVLPLAIVVDFAWVKIIDLSALFAVQGISTLLKLKGVKLVFINCTSDIAKSFKKTGFENDGSSEHLDLDFFLSRAEGIPVRVVEEKEIVFDDVPVPTAELYLGDGVVEPVAKEVV